MHFQNDYKTSKLVIKLNTINQMNRNVYYNTNLINAVCLR